MLLKLVGVSTHILPLLRPLFRKLCFVRRLLRQLVLRLLIDT